MCLVLKGLEPQSFGNSFSLNKIAILIECTGFANFSILSIRLTRQLFQSSCVIGGHQIRLAVANSGHQDLIYSKKKRTRAVALERWYAARARSRTTEVAGASDSVYVSHPKEVADLIENAARAVSKSRSDSPKADKAPKTGAFGFVALTPCGKDHRFHYWHSVIATTLPSIAITRPYHRDPLPIEFSSPSTSGGI